MCWVNQSQSCPCHLPGLVSATLLSGWLQPHWPLFCFSQTSQALACPGPVGLSRSALWKAHPRHSEATRPPFVSTPWSAVPSYLRYLLSWHFSGSLADGVFTPLFPACLSSSPASPLEHKVCTAGISSNADSALSSQCLLSPQVSFPRWDGISHCTAQQHKVRIP